eukprot:CAMPEP_0168329154 /NCGR_PEP_ID=MMETSP0213-20121227/6939_1 /TAXON_ID=151035 /ORGANISM="Euplotes harpa, Strain FSP1.4" /LENGTH=205 /DNA_ID=CAMNT_0008332425 /DNA_START=1 /DNA_END=615 /DNA_ORIENTATION=-
MESMTSSTRLKYFYPPTKTILEPACKPGDERTIGHKQLYRKTGTVVQHRDAPEPYPPRRFHQGDPSDLYVLKGGTANYEDNHKAVSEKDQAAFFGFKSDIPKHIATNATFGENVMKFFGDGTSLQDKKERDKETIEAARAKFHQEEPPVYTGTMSVFGRKTLKQEKKEFGTITKTFAEAYQEAHGKVPKGTASQINTFSTGTKFK